MAAQGPLQTAGLAGLLQQVFRYVWAAPWSLVGLGVAVPALMLGARAQLVHGVLEVSGGTLGRQAARGVGPSNVLAITLGHVVLGSSAELLAQLRAHERVHVRQYERWGPVFVPAYLASSLWQALRGRHPYRDNHFERPAFAVEAGDAEGVRDVGAGTAAVATGPPHAAAAGGQAANTATPAARR